MTITGTASGRKDKDFFSFTAPGAGPLGIQATAQGGVVQIEIERNSTEVFETEPNDGVNGGTLQLEAGATYRLRVRSKSNAGAPAYTVTLQFDGTGGGGGGGGGGGEGNIVQETESNNSKSQADTFSLTAAGPVQLQGTSVGRRDNDYFSFVASENGTVSVNVATTGSDVQLEVETSSSLHVFETEPNDGVNSGSFSVKAGVRYYVRLRSRTDASGDYLADLAFSTPLN